MAILTTEAIILKGWNLRETSKILLLYTRDYGKIKVVAKAARDLKSKFRGCIEPLTHIKAIYYDRENRDLQLLSKTDLIDAHYNIIGNPAKTSLGLTVAELIYKAVTGQEPSPQIFDLCVNTLRILNKSKSCHECALWYFQTHFIDFMGFKPTWERCIQCGKSLGAAGGHFIPEKGGLKCPECEAGQGGLRVGSDTLEILFWLQKCGVNEVDHLQPEPAQQAEIRKLFDMYFKTHITHMRSLYSLEMFYHLTG